MMFFGFAGRAVATPSPPGSYVWSRQEVDALYSNSGTYFQLHDNLSSALDCYSKSGNHAKVSELLVEHSKQNPGTGSTIN